MSYAGQISFALLLALPIACIVWTFTQEEVFREVRDALKDYQQRHPHSPWRKKIAYLPTCPYCFSHYVTAAFVALFQFPMLTDDCRGYIASLFTLVLLANLYLTIYHLLRVALRGARAWADGVEALADQRKHPHATPLRKHRPRQAMANSGNV